jgi:hypothetical protein
MSSQLQKFIKDLKAGKSVVVYEVWRNTPCGDVAMGLYIDRKEAQTEADEWNKGHTHPWDQAQISPRIIKV